MELGASRVRVLRVSRKKTDSESESVYIKDTIEIFRVVLSSVLDLELKIVAL